MARRYFFAVSIIAVNCIQLVFGHSWIACSDYAEKNAAYYDHDKCRGYPRDAHKFAEKRGEFGADTGYDYHASEGQPCKTERNDNLAYNEGHPMAVYYPGQQVVLAHPMKNHGSDKCTNAHIPDNGNFIYRGEKDAASDPKLSDFKKNLVANLGVKSNERDINFHTKYPKPGYQNAPAFCENTDKSLGTYSFNVPRNLEPGRYTFIWLWAFNSDKDVYSTCFEVEIVEDSTKRNNKLKENNINNFYEPCGGTTSDNGVGNSNAGCDEGGGGSPATQPTTTRRTTSRPRPTTNRPRSTTIRSRRTTRPTNPPATAGTGKDVTVYAGQLSGEIGLPEPEPGTQRRIIDMLWQCPGTVNYWSARVVAEATRLSGGGFRQRLVQDRSDVERRKIYYTAYFPAQCDLRVPPVATLVADEK